MKNMNRYGLGLALALGLLLANAGFAQTITQADQKKITESCCSMACCSHDAAASMKDAKEPAKHEGCCGGDSCEMKMKAGAKQMNHSDMAGCCGCCADSCDMKMRDGAKSQMDHSTMAGCCGCCGDSCEKNMKDMKHKEKTN
jgi:hypothetical protein